MPDFDMSSVKAWAGAPGAAAAPPAPAADPAEEEAEEEAGPVDCIAALQGALDVAVTSLSALDVTDEPATVTKKLKGLLASVKELQTEAEEVLTAHEEAHADDEPEEEEERVLLGDEEGGGSGKSKKAPPPAGDDSED